MDQSEQLDAERESRPKPIDSRLPRWNQGVLTIALVIAFVANFWYLVPLMGLILGLGTAFGSKANPVMLFFVKVIRPRLQPPRELEDPRPPRFASLVGTIFLAAATLAFVIGVSLVGWILTLIVAGLAGLAATTGICVGCEIYVLVRRQFGTFSGPWRVAAGEVAQPSEAST